MAAGGEVQTWSQPGKQQEPSLESGLNWALEYHTLIPFFLKGTIMKYKCILFSPWLLKNPGEVVFGPSLPPVKRNLYPVVWIEWRSVRWGLQVHNYSEPQKVGTWV